MSIHLLRRQFTVQEYRQMARAGILLEDDRVELLDGEIIQMSPIGRRHAACVRRLIGILTQLLGNRAIVDAQNPVELSDRSQPQPDIALLQPRPDFYEARHPQPQDIFLIIEVADTTAEIDREVKIPLYAISGVVEVWLVDINESAIAIYRQPTAHGYDSVQQFRCGQSISILAFSDINLTVDEILG